MSGPHARRAGTHAGNLVAFRVRFRARRPRGFISSTITTEQLSPEERPRRPLPPHPRRRIPRRHGHGAEPGLVPLRRPERPADPGLLLVLRDAARSATTTRRWPTRSSARRSCEAALTKPSTSDIYTEHFARFVETFSSLAIPPSHADHMFFVEGGSLAIENALKTAFDWKVRKNLARRQGREGQEGPPLQERLPRPLRLLALDDEHGRPAQDRSTSRSSTGRASPARGCASR